MRKWADYVSMTLPWEFYPEVTFPPRTLLQLIFPFFTLSSPQIPPPVSHTFSSDFMLV